MIPFRETINRRDCTIEQVKMDFTKTWTASTFIGKVQSPTGIEYRNHIQGSYTEGSLIVYSEIKLNLKTENVENSSSTYVQTKEGAWLEIVKEMSYIGEGVLSALNHYKYIAEPRANSRAGL